MSKFVIQTQPSDAELYRLEQARQLLREAGFVEHADRTWHPAPNMPAVPQDVPDAPHAD